MRNQTLRGLTAFILLVSLTLPSSAWALEPPNWADCTWEGKQYACMTPEQIKDVLKIYLVAGKAEKTHTLLEEQLLLSEDINATVLAGMGKLMVQVSESSALLTTMREDLIRQDVGQTDVWTLVLYIGGATLVGFAGGVVTTLILMEDK